MDNKKYTHYGQLIVRKIRKIACCHQMSYFKAEMHQIRFPLGLRVPHLAGGTYSASQTRPPIAVFKGPISKGSGEGGEEEGRGPRGEGKEKREGISMEKGWEGKERIRTLVRKEKGGEGIGKGGDRKEERGEEGEECQSNCFLRPE